jgi:hypothetical protein
MPSMIEISRIVEDPRLYPRVGADWITVHKYSEALATGATFPAIELAAKGGELLLIDGKHRVESHKKLKRVEILAEIKQGLTDAEIFARAVKLNCQHGRCLSTQERLVCGKRLQTEFGMQAMELENILGMKLDSLHRLQDERMQLVPVGVGLLTTQAMAEMTKKAPLKDVEVNSAETLASVQNRMGARDQRQIFTEALNIIQNGLLDSGDAELIEIVRKLGTEIKKRLHTKAKK